MMGKNYRKANKNIITKTLRRIYNSYYFHLKIRTLGVFLMMVVDKIKMNNLITQMEEECLDMLPRLFKALN
jgi:hypothetical protein